VTPADIRPALMAYMRRNRVIGRANAVRREDVLFDIQCEWPDLTDRQMRRAYEEMEICTTAAKPYGLYLPASAAEVFDFLREYGCHAHPAHVQQRLEIFKRAYPEWFEEKAQMSLPL
jgi:hypothetical protein